MMEGTDEPEIRVLILAPSLMSLRPWLISLGSQFPPLQSGDNCASHRGATRANWDLVCKMHAQRGYTVSAQCLQA